MVILGVNAYHPDSSACIIQDGMLIAAVEEERFNRIKHWAGFPRLAIRYCLKECGVGIQDVDYLVVNKDVSANLHKKVFFVLTQGAGSGLIKNRFAHLSRIAFLGKRVAEEFSLAKDLHLKIRGVEHHRSHLGSAFFVSGFQDATVVSIDGFGDFTSCMVGRGEENKIKVLYEINYPHSLGMFYTALTQFLGFNKFGDEFKVMGLAAYGKPTRLPDLEKLLVIKPRGRFELNLDYFSFHTSQGAMLWDDAEPVLGNCFSNKLCEIFGPSRAPEDEILPQHCDIAASFQAYYEKVFFHILNYAYKLTGIPRLCLSGGCALNSLANGKIFDRTPFKDVYIQPGSSDAGGSLGASYYFYNQVLGNKRVFKMETPYWGPAFSEDEIAVVLKEKAADLTGIVIEKMDDDDALCGFTAEKIANGLVVGWFQGRLEWGPRALGNRSILVDPRRNDMKDILNARIKRREWFRPFAPAILLERVGEYFEKEYPDPFMLKVYSVKPEKRACIPAVTHVDGTGRLQTVSEKENALFTKLIRAFDAITGVPVLLNTSFNENEPIVCTPAEAIDCFLRTKMDMLVLGRFVLKR